MRSIILEHCWICPTHEGIHNHHCVPQAYGGVDGPQVTLCGTHHTLVHTLALKPCPLWDNSLRKHTTDPVKIAKLRELVEIIYRARMATRNTVKPLQISHKLNMERSKKLRELKHLMGQSSITATIDACIDAVYNQANQLKQ
jgi:hypothetical protein